MNKLSFFILALASTAAMATEPGPAAGNSQRGVSTAAQQQQQNSTATSQSNAANQGNSQNITFTAPSTTTVNTTSNSNGTMTVNGETTQRLTGGTDSTMKYEYGNQTQTIRNTPSVSGPPLASSNDTCMGSASGSANVPGFGVSLGKTYTDTNCVMLKNARELWNMGMKGAAMALMCTDSANKEALELTGYVCPTKKNRNSASAEEYTDPVVRARLGLPALQ